MHIIEKTALHSLHTELKAKITSFAGYAMPLHYPAGIIKEHLHTRSKAGFFDISHMGQIQLIGDQSAAELEKLVPGNIQNLETGRQRYTVLTNKSGGIIDDLIIANLGTHLLLIVNAARKNTVLQHLQNHLPHHCQISLESEQALLALQGPQAIAVLEQYDTRLSSMPYMSISQTAINDIPCTISRSGYTGEDGFEISVSNKNALTLAQLLLSHAEVLPIGLGARDSLRLEAGLCLYGHELSPNITAVEANLVWLVAKDRSNYLGAKRILFQFCEGAERYRVGIATQGKNILREGSELFDQQGDKVGYISSGSFGASLQKPVAMGYVLADFITPGKPLVCNQRNKQIPVTVTQLPFIKHRYYRSKD
ncbi:MAG TPA: glycine cleavage system aminomethyltransferase GcvT [Methyloprofundus sp.]|uniref:glycine cleavage system aminomethyltransferase GcvT n=1 Tax=Methyloprofundus sp. TaxID=2020875 RepID=UPI0017BFE708|nr:glycine cleavage system aminomethyltransferase GcvT [Methyloprofundus sp.]HIG64530.1 glycine cleavage system aminomethyltransferase GcvT [Methyloprofundus sp.]HIL78224.1 glycine cleavage system aminomethyltransferase GcvT [Methylococcales bacterium]